MSNASNSDEIRARYVDALGAPLGEMMHDLYNEVVWVHAKWVEYRELFGTNEERLALLNESASWTFFIVQRVLIDDIILHLARLTDSPRSKGKQTVTIQALPKLLDSKRIQAEIRERVEVVVADLEFARVHRNRRIAHRDLRTMRDAHPEPLPAATREAIERSLEGIRGVMNFIEGELLDSNVFYEDGVHSLRGASMLLRQLAAGRERIDEIIRIRREGGPEAVSVRFPQAP